MKRFINLQLFADGGADGAGAASGDANAGGTADTGVNGGSPVPQGKEDLSKVIYGISTKEDVADSQKGEEATAPKEVDKSKAFENMIKKGGEYAEEFNKRTQDIINKRFKETKGLQEQLQSHNDILETLAAKYGVKADDVEGIKKAIEADETLYEEAAFKEGLSVQQYREKLALEKENARLREAEEHRVQVENSNRIYAKWVEDGEAFAQRYGITNFDLATECENPEFTRLLSDGIGVESAYKVIHMDDMIGGAMAKTAEQVTQNMARNIASRASRPSENGLVSSNTSTMKTDVNKLGNSDIDEIIKRVRAGETISFG